MAPSSWKGSLRAALWKIGYDETHATICRLFGNEKGTEEDFKAGRLHFFPTFFDQEGLEIINPHDRERRIGNNPILFESVPVGTLGVFSLLYVSFGDRDRTDAEKRREVAADLETIGTGVQAMFCVHGFGAKTSSGFGAAGDNFPDGKARKSKKLPEGRLTLKAILAPPSEVAAFEQTYGGQLDDLSPDEWRDLLDEPGYQAYLGAIAARERHQENIQFGQITEALEGFAGLVETAKAWAAALREEVNHG